MPTRDLSKLLLKSADNNEAETARFEKELAARYRASYKNIEAEIAKLYASIGKTDDLLSAARKYNRLNTLLEAINSEYKDLTNTAIKSTLSNSSRSFADGAYSTEWAYDQALGVSIKWPVLPVEAIRASVWDASSGEDFEERYKNWSVKDVVKFKSSITQSLAQGQGYAKTARRIRDDLNTSYWQALRIVQTESNRNYNQGHLDVYDELEDLGIVARKMWVATLDKNTRDSHGAMDGEYADDEGLFYPGGVPAEAPGLSGDPSEDINCIPEDSIPIGIDIEKLYKRYYDGELVIIKTSRGNEIRVTPNHPILTTQGWIKANSIKIGYDIIGMEFGREGIWLNPNIQNIPPTAAKIFDSFSIVFPSKRSGGISEQFHGDGKDGDIDIIRADSKLRNSIQTSIYKPLVQFILSSSNSIFSRLPSNGSLFKLFHASLYAAYCIVRPFRKFRALLWRSFGHTQIHGRRSSANGDVSISEYSANRITRNAEFDSKSLFGNTAKVFTDNVVCIKFIPYTGHVYNLQTKQGWYGVYHGNGNMSIVHNCRCRIVEIVDDMKPEFRRIRGEGIVPYEEYDSWAARNGKTDKGWPLENKTKG
jgi:SPP1 gp7 family putative phage head morphogenesis protein